ncbi:Glycosyltransferase like family 2 [Salinimicrobium catena]|uniref:Glycosyltransferase like family 2 n=1 Tax=Salinimicrobium catena TaxID=390640 RepID=A0A1H5NAP9_9FLAO|nr:glycosyltransferase [Salinimicrobium catena]SDL41057.1 Glycosyltransferase like family 2 [Salinimicrobium catena]SEE98530.1 Glycosyltransferase like family 2 [Salinimicrobium catena]
MVSIIYANRDRDVKRIRNSLESLRRQSSTDFEVVFVDYGSGNILVDNYRELLAAYDFARFFPLEVSGLLWNKSRALNYGINKASRASVFIADVDLIFHPESIKLFGKLANPRKFFLFQLGYLGQKESKKLSHTYRFEELHPARHGKVNGMVLAPRKALLEVNGLDEFFHFYGAEDEDLFARLEIAGYQREESTAAFFYHNWHQSFSGSEDELLTGNPRVKNITRLNQRHFLRNRERKIIKPKRQTGMGEIIPKQERELLKKPTLCFRIPNILAQMEHFLREELPSCKGEVIKVDFVEDAYFGSLKHKVKKILGRQSQPYISMKEVNDMLLKQILFCYRDHNYSLQISEDLKSIQFRIQL